MIDVSDGLLADLGHVGGGLGRRDRRGHRGAAGESAAGRGGVRARPRSPGVGADRRRRSRARRDLPARRAAAAGLDGDRHRSGRERASRSTVGRGMPRAAGTTSADADRPGPSRARVAREPGAVGAVACAHAGRRSIEVMDDGWAASLAPVAPDIGRDGRLPARRDPRRPQLPASRAAMSCARSSARCAGVKVLIVGQDPYPTPGHADRPVVRGRPPRPPAAALAGQHLPRAGADVGIAPPAHGDLTGWSDQGVLLLNRVLTVAPGQPGSHRGKGWEPVTEAAIRALVERYQGGQAPLVAILWGKDAQSLRSLLDGVPVHRLGSPVADVGGPRLLRIATLQPRERAAGPAGRCAGRLGALRPSSGGHQCGSRGSLASVAGDGTGFGRHNVTT